MTHDGGSDIPRPGCRQPRYPPEHTTRESTSKRLQHQAKVSFLELMQVMACSTS